MSKSASNSASTSRCYQLTPRRRSSSATSRTPVGNGSRRENPNASRCTTSSSQKVERFLICADGGGSNGYRLRLWKWELAQLATETGLMITVCHFPPGTSKWNQIEHRLFSYISMNWRGRPLVSHEVIVELIGATTTRTGLKVEAHLDPASYPGGIRVPNEAMATIPLEKHEFHGEWNYTIRPLRKSRRTRPD